MRIDLLPTGVEPVDALVGGIAAGQITLVSGVPQSGKTCLALTYLLAALGRGEGACLVTTDAPEAVLEFCEKYLGTDLKPRIRSRALTLLSYGPGFENKIRSIGTIEKPAGELAMLGTQRALRCLVFDTVDPILVATDASKLKQFIRSTINSLLNLKVTCVCTSVAASGGDTLQLGAQEFGAQVACSIDLRREGEQRFLNVVQASWCQLDQSLVPVELVHGKGMVSAGPPRAVAPLPAAEVAQPVFQNVKTVMLEAAQRPLAPAASSEGRGAVPGQVSSGARAHGPGRSTPAQDAALKPGASLGEVLGMVEKKLELPEASQPRVGKFYDGDDSDKPKKR